MRPQNDGGSKGRTDGGTTVSRRTLDRRVTALERRHGIGRGEMYVVALPDGLDCDAALAALGVTPSPADFVVVMNFGETKPKLLNRCALVR